MREIKFRVWDEENDEMVYEAGITPEGIPYTIPSHSESFDQFNYYPHCHKMQYSGLKDKNGVEVYHKDIVDWIDGEYSFRAVVELDYWQWYLKGINPIDNYDIADYTDKDQTDLVVVGNLFQNPELLEAAE